MTTEKPALLKDKENQKTCRSESDDTEVKFKMVFEKQRKARRDPDFELEKPILSKWEKSFSLNFDEYWLFKFVNLGRTPGKLTPYTSKSIPKWRPDIRPPDFFKDKIYNLQNGDKLARDGDDLWRIQPDGKEPIFLGRFVDFSENNFWKLIQEHGAPFVVPFGRKNLRKIKTAILKIKDLWKEIRIALSYKTENDLEVFVMLDNGGPGIHIRRASGGKPFFFAKPDDIYGGIVACFANFFFNRKDLLALIKLCPVCGRFFLSKDKRQKHCDPKCRNLSSRQSREEHAKIVKGYNLRIRRLEQRREICEFLIGAGWPKDKASEEANLQIFSKNRTFKEFEREWLDSPHYYVKSQTPQKTRR